MSDFILSTSTHTKKRLSDAICSIYEEKSPRVYLYSGLWGVFACSENVYSGFEPYENDDFIIAVIGGPLLMFRNNEFILKDNNNEGTQAIFERWEKGELQPENDLNGPYTIVIIDKNEQDFIVISDIMSFIPVYKYEKSSEVIISSHVDVLATISNQKASIDGVSVVDFILHGFVTYPHSFYKDIKQIQPASYHKINNKELKIEAKYYWRPIEQNVNQNINETAKEIREALSGYISKVTNITQNIAQFISGGEDSRALAGLLKDYERTGYIYIDDLNREGKIARKIARKYSAKFEYRERSKDHYLKILPASAKLVGAGAEYHHAHTYGFHKELKKYDAVFGGLLADALLKGSHISKSKLRKKLPFTMDVKTTSDSAYDLFRTNYFPQELLNQIEIRRNQHLKYIQSFRSKESADEWFELWPSSMNRNIPNIHVNRRLFRSYEPFTCNEIVKISAKVKQEWKLNRKLFHKAIQPYLKQSQWVLHGDGWLPYYSKKINFLPHFFTWTSRQIGRRIGLIKGHHGPWAEWKPLIRSVAWTDTLEKYYLDVDYIGDELKECIEKQVNENNLTVLEYLAMTQVLYQLQRRDEYEI